MIAGRLESEHAGHCWTTPRLLDTRLQRVLEPQGEADFHFLQRMLQVRRGEGAQDPRTQAMLLTKLVAPMHANGVVQHQLFGDLSGKVGIKPTAYVDCGQFPLLRGRILLELRPLSRQVGLSVSA